MWPRPGEVLQRHTLGVIRPDERKAFINAGRVAGSAVPQICASFRFDDEFVNYQFGAPILKGVGQQSTNLRLQQSTMKLAEPAPTVELN